MFAEDGCRIWTSGTGHGEPLVLCHGGPGLWDYFGEVAPLLADVAHPIRWDQRGCGRSEPRGPFSVDRSVADLEAVRVGVGAARIALLGHSWGAMLVLRYTLEHPDRVSRLIYVSGTGIDPDDTWKPAFLQNLRTTLGNGLPRWEELNARERTPAEDRELAVLQWSADSADPATALADAECLVALVRHQPRLQFRDRRLRPAGASGLRRGWCRLGLEPCQPDPGGTELSASAADRELGFRLAPGCNARRFRSEQPSTLACPPIFSRCGDT